MGMVRKSLRAVLVALGWICALLALGIPVWFAAAAFGTKWGFFDTATGLDWMTRGIGRPLLLAAVAAGAAALVLMLLYRLIGRRFFGAVVSPVLALGIGAAGLGWAWQVDRQRAAAPAILDVTTDRADPPHFSPAFESRRLAGHQSLDYVGKHTASGRDLAALQAETYPDIATVRVARPPEAVFADALAYAHGQRWRVGTASPSVGMFEAGTESFWFGLRDDIVVRIREDGEGGSLVDIRSLSRRPIHDLGRNARRVRDFSAAIGREDF
jgi:hypothetical protein